MDKDILILLNMVIQRKLDDRGRELEVYLDMNKVADDHVRQANAMMANIKKELHDLICSLQTH